MEDKENIPMHVINILYELPFNSDDCKTLVGKSTGNQAVGKRCKMKIIRKEEN
jgi:hypothetical protein